MEIMDLVLQLVTNSTVVTFILTVIPAPYLAATIATLSALLILSELLAKLPTKYNALYQVVADILHKLLKAFKKPIPPEVQEASDAVDARVRASKQGGEVAAAKMKVAVDEENKKRSDELLGQ